MNATNMSTNTAMQQRRDSDQVERMQERPVIAPAVDIYENKDELLILVDMPGVSNDGVKINLEKLELTIEGKRTAPGGEGRALAGESAWLDYQRTFLLPQGIDADKIAAELTRGVLRIHLPKSEAQKPRQIQVKAG
jgi:HSP20 family molecular chaperone IbpA